MGKKKDTDLVAGFFGDNDLDWLDEDDSLDREVTGDELPIAVPPPPGGNTEPPPTIGSDWGNRITEAPKASPGLSSAPTLVFSSVDTLPPMPAPEIEAPPPVLKEPETLRAPPTTPPIDMFGAAPAVEETPEEQLETPKAPLPPEPTPFADFQPAAESTPFPDSLDAAESTAPDSEPAADSTPFPDFQPAAESTPFPDFQP
ncbi:MAG: hypothetical protein HN348_13780, partial [Proteobacteria bacterium]|nr:hypothetical protein [Pseudomonadota bacterium]